MIHLRLIYTKLFVGSFLFLSAPLSFAASTLWEEVQNNDAVTGIYSNTNLSKDDIKNGNITYEKIPMIIVSAINSLLLLVGTVCVVAIIYHAVKMQVYGVAWDSSWVDKAKKWVYSSIMGFILSMSAWFIMTRLVAIFDGIT
jgi:hypothetical protein